MNEKLIELQKLLDSFPKPKDFDTGIPDELDPTTTKIDSEGYYRAVYDWHEKFEPLFSAFQELSLKETSLRKLLEHGELDRLAENCHDAIVKELAEHPNPPWGSGWAKVLSPVIWAWYEKVFDETSTRKVSGVEEK